MDTGETTDAKPAPRRPDVELDEPVYDGMYGHTRLESVHVTIPGGYVRSVQVYTAVNVGTHPDLRDAAVEGALHRFEGGEELAIPFVYHDPSARRFALVLPEVLRHRELVERAKLLSRLADDTVSSIPPYVREATVVIGPAELAAYLSRAGQAAAKTRAREEELDAREARLGEHDAALDARERAFTTREASLVSKEEEISTRRDELEKQVERLVEREKRLHARAEDVTRREDEVRLQQEEVEAGKRDLDLREQELERRLAMLRQRETELGSGQRESASPSGRPRSVPPPAPASVPPPAPVDVADEDDVEEIEELEQVQTNSNVQLAASVEMLEDDRDRISATDVEEIVDEDDVEEIEDVDAVREVTGVEPIPLAPDDPDRTKVAHASAVEGLGATPPARFVEDRTVEMAATLTDRVWLFVRVDDGQETALGESADLLVQLAVVQGHPVVILALVGDASSGRPYVRRTALDPRNPDHRRVLSALRQRFEGTVALFRTSGSFERSFEVEAARRVNVAMILERADRLGDEATVDAATALERALAVPPPLRDDAVPFRADDPAPPADAREAAERLDELQAYCSPDKLEHAMLSLSIPRDVVDASMRRVLGDAVRHGLALPASLASRAVSVGVAAEPGELVATQIDSFRATCARTDQGGLSPERVADNWERLLAAAADAELPIDSDIHEIAWRAIRSVRGESSTPHAMEAVDPAKLPDMGAPELVLLLDHPKMRRQAALELCRRSEPELLDALFRAVRKMPRAEVARVVPRILEFGEAAGDVLIDGLTAKKTFVRQAAALSLGQLKLRRAVVPLLHLLQNEPSDVWREVARVLGEFGTGAFRALSRGAKDPKAQPERFAWALAHLANHGCAKQVEQLAGDRDARVARVAQDAMTLRERAGRDAAEVRGAQPMQGEEPVKLFSHRFYAEIAGTAPELDLADVVE